MDRPKKLEFKVILDVVQNKSAKEGIPMTSKPLEAIIEELVETNQHLTNMNKLIKASTISSDKVELTELPKDSVLPTGFRFIDLSILSDVFSLLACPNCSTTNTFKLIDIEDKKKGLTRFMQIK